MRVVCGGGQGTRALDRRMAMAQVITFYIPERYKKRSKWIPPEEKGKLINFPLLERKSA